MLYNLSNYHSVATVSISGSTEENEAPENEEKMEVGKQFYA